jgi:hypothetical protein
MSQEPLFDDIEESAPETDKASSPDSALNSIMDAFITQALNEVEEVSPLDAKPVSKSPEQPKEPQKSNGAAANYLSEVLARELGAQSTLNAFPSLSELSTLAQQLVTINKESQDSKNGETQNETEKLTELAGYFKKSTKANSDLESTGDNSPANNQEDSS